MSSPQGSTGFRGTAMRLLATLRPDRPRIIAMTALALVGNAAMLTVPLLLGHATDVILDGIGDGAVDFGAFTRDLLMAGVLTALFGVCTVAQSRLTATVVQRMAFRLRERTDVVLSRLPLAYFDTQPRGDLLSRTTNDIDNLAQSAQQTANRILASVFLFVGSLVMMLRISLLLTAVAVVLVPVTVWTAKVIGRRAKPQFARQWKATGSLGGHLEDVYTGHDLVTAFGRWRQARQTFVAHNDELRTDRRRRAVPLRTDRAGPGLPRQPRLRAGRGGRRAARRGRRPDHRRHPGVHPVRPAVQPADLADRVDDRADPVRDRLGRTGLRTARRRTATAGPGRAAPSGRRHRARSTSPTCPSATGRTSP